VVQAKSASIADLGTAVNTASKQGVVAISNSYGGGDLSDATYGANYNHPNIAVTASTGDNGYQGGSFPASSDYVTAVGGTTLTAASNARGWSAWVPRSRSSPGAAATRRRCCWRRPGGSTPSTPRWPVRPTSKRSRRQCLPAASGPVRMRVRWPRPRTRRAGCRPRVPLTCSSTPS